jgi:hypothetical protein
MKLKLDLHPIYNDSRRIEEALQQIIDEAVEKHASEVEIIPGKGSGALKKSVLRFLDRPEIKSRYHRMDKDSDNWGRLFIYFRHERPEPAAKSKANIAKAVLSAPCGCCTDPITIPEPDDLDSPLSDVLCTWCGSPNRLTVRRDRRGKLHLTATLYYPDE